MSETSGAGDPHGERSLVLQRQRRLKWPALDWLEAVLMMLCGFTLAGFCAAVVADIITRTIGAPWLWLQEVTSTFFIYGIFIGAAVATRRNDHLFLAAIGDFFTGTPRLLIETAIRLAREGNVVVMFPEGTRRKKGLVKLHQPRARSGAARIALEAEVPLIPAAVAGTETGIRWQQADILSWQPTLHQFDLVTANFLQLLKVQRHEVYARLASAVRPGGHLLVVRVDLRLNVLRLALEAAGLPRLRVDDEEPHGKAEHEDAADDHADLRVLGELPLHVPLPVADAMSAAAHDRARPMRRGVSGRLRAIAVYTSFAVAAKAKSRSPIWARMECTRSPEMARISGSGGRAEV